MYRWRTRYPLYPQKQTSQKRESMPAKGQKATLRAWFEMKEAAN